MSSAVSMPSRVIISSVNAKTPSKGRGPARSERLVEHAFDVALDAAACRHMWTVSDATSTAAVIASSPSHSAWLRAMEEHARRDAQQRSTRDAPVHCRHERRARSSAGRPG